MDNSCFYLFDIVVEFFRSKINIPVVYFLLLFLSSDCFEILFLIEIVVFHCILQLLKYFLKFLIFINIH